MKKASSNPSTPTTSQSTELEKILLQRAQRAAEIIANVHKYKICEGCDSIVTAETITCPTCHSYRFDSTPQRVIKQAEHLATRPPKTLQADDYS